MVLTPKALIRLETAPRVVPVSMVLVAYTVARQSLAPFVAASGMLPVGRTRISMLQIHDSLLWIGHARDVREPRRLFDAGIAAVVDVAYEEPPTRLSRQLIYCRFPVNDGGGNDASVLRHAVQCVVDLLGSGTRTMVACSAGMSRSPTIAAFALAAHLGQAPDDVVARIASAKALEVKAPFWNDVANVFSQIRRPTTKNP